ncbi:alpha/beta hydrolase [Crossiella sp. CA198]|uniref:alpha/beta hydrolase n=1 Tax=Crossiella sp. CA198 TaxID=3455607 RepID=UPI003F8D581F
MRFTAAQRLDDGVLEREFTLGEIPGILWTPGSEPAPLILIGHPGGFHKRLPRLVARARHYAAEYGFAAAAIDAPGCGDRPRSAAEEQAGADLRRAKEAGEPIEEILEAFIIPMVEKAVPEWRTTLDAPLQFLLQWDDEGNDRQQVLDLFDTFGAKEKTLHANLGGHTGTPWFEVDGAARFFARHLK